MANKKPNKNRQTKSAMNPPAGATTAATSAVGSHGPQTLAPSAALSPELPMLAIPSSASATHMHISDVAAHMDIRIGRAARLKAFVFLAMPAFIAFYILFLRPDQAVIGLDWFWLALMAFLFLANLPIFFTWGVRYRIGGDGIFIKAGKICSTGPIPWPAITGIKSHNKIIRIYLDSEACAAKSADNNDTAAMIQSKPVILAMYNKDTTVDQLLTKIAQYRPDLF